MGNSAPDVLEENPDEKDSCVVSPRPATDETFLHGGGDDAPRRPVTTATIRSAEQMLSKEPVVSSNSWKKKKKVEWKGENDLVKILVLKVDKEAVAEWSVCCCGI